MSKTKPEKRSTTAVLIVDMINDFDFPDGKKVFKSALPAAKAIAKLKERAKNAGCAIVYVNDNFKKWHDSFATTVEQVERTDEGRQIAEILRPGKGDYYILKPERSGFYETPLEVLLRHLEVEEVIITGMATDMCVLSTAQDACMRKYKLRVPSDCCAAADTRSHKQALELLERTADADIRPSSKIRF